MDGSQFPLAAPLSRETLRRGIDELRRRAAAPPPERVLFLPGWCLERHPELCEQARRSYGFDRVEALDRRAVGE